MLNNKMSKGRRAYIITLKILMALATVFTCAIVIFLIVYVMVKGIPNISWEMLTTKPSYLSDRIGILPDILNKTYFQWSCIFQNRNKVKKMFFFPKSTLLYILKQFYIILFCRI